MMPIIDMYVADVPDEKEQIEKQKESQLDTIAVDFDKTLANTSGYPDYNILDPLDDAVESMQQLKKDGWKLIIYTARSWHDYNLVKAWLKMYDIPFESICCGKVFAKYYVDDRGLQFNSWKEIMKKIK